MGKFDSFSSEMLDFLHELKANNTKDWFTANRVTYDTHLKAPAKKFADDMALALSDLTGHDHRSKIFRIYRDFRFSRDKTPYNAHLHLAFTPTDLAGQPPMWFFGLSPEKLSIGCGVFQFERAELDTFRTAMAGQDGDKLIRLTAEMKANGFRIAEPELKRVPRAFDKDHPNAEALRRKGFTVWMDVGDPVFAIEPKLAKRTAALFSQLMPVFLFLCRIR